jgi:hypothetical protein
MIVVSFYVLLCTLIVNVDGMMVQELIEIFFREQQGRPYLNFFSIYITVEVSRFPKPKRKRKKRLQLQETLSPQI